VKLHVTGWGPVPPEGHPGSLPQILARKLRTVARTSHVENPSEDDNLVLVGLRLPIGLVDLSSTVGCLLVELNLADSDVNKGQRGAVSERRGARPGR
jgi:hypothetical protein